MLEFQAGGTPIDREPRHQRRSPFKKLLFGAAYYPEQSDADETVEDAARMAAAGVNVVRMAEFAWDRMEPQPGQFDFSLFDQSIASLGARGIDTILCTPTAAPPRWLTENHPEYLRVNVDGRIMQHGSRQHVCTTHPGFRAESARITRAMAEHFAGHPNVIGWQTDNEFNCHFQECYCAACGEGFRQWLHKRYESVENLNRAWGTAFWAQTYETFAQIPLPHPAAPAVPNPGHQLDYYRFISDSVIAFQRGQVEVLRAVQPRWWISHNGLFPHVDYWKLNDDLDLPGVDIYPGFFTDRPEDFIGVGIKYEECRAAGGNFIVPELESGPGGQRCMSMSETSLPGQMRLWAYQALAHGADAVLHFRWRTARFGAEFYWNGVLDHDNVPRRRYAEFSREGDEFRRISDIIIGTVPLVRAAVLIDLDQDEAHDTMPLGLPGPGDQRRRAYRQLMLRGLPAGFVNASDSFAGLEFLFVPSFVLMDEILEAKLSAFVRSGGTLVATARTGTRNRHNQVIKHTPPGLLAGIFGVTIEEFGRLKSPTLTLLTKKSEFPAGPAYEILQARDAEILATWTGPSVHAAPGRPAISRRNSGDGTVIYVGTYLSDQNASHIFDLALAHTKMKSLAKADEFVEVTCRCAPDRQFIFLLNHSAEARDVTELPEGADLLTGQISRGSIRLAPYEATILEVPVQAPPLVKDG